MKITRKMISSFALRTLLLIFLVTLAITSLACRSNDKRPVIRIRGNIRNLHIIQVVYSNDEASQGKTVDVPIDAKGSLY